MPAGAYSTTMRCAIIDSIRRNARPVRHATFLAPGAPIRAWVGARFKF
jgi:hypothetical protein